MTARPRRRAAQRPQMLADHRDPAHSVFTTAGIAPAQKRLFILFSGEDAQFYLPLAVVLHTLPGGPKDVLVIRSGLAAFFTWGKKASGENLWQLAQSIRTRFDTESYASVSVLGYSAGGVYALRVADMLRADLGLSFGGRFATRVPRMGLDIAGSGGAFDVFCACYAQKAPRLVNVAGAKHETDCRAMQRMAATRPALVRHYLVNYGGHNVLQRMLGMGMLAPFLRLCHVRSTALLRSLTLPFWAYGSFVRGLRRMVGIQ